MFERILVPVDFTEKNERAIEMARNLARGENAEVTLLHVVETLDLPFEELEEFYQKLHDEAACRLDALAEPLAAAGIPVVTCIEYGRRVPEIVAYAQEKKMDLIIMSSRRLDLEEPATALATISHQVAILAQTPVLLVK